MKLPRWTTFYGGRKHIRTKFFLSPSKLKFGRKNSIPEKFTGILHFKQIEIIDFKPEDSLVAENNNTSLFIIISHCFTVRVSNQLAFRVRRAVTFQ